MVEPRNNFFPSETSRLFFKIYLPNQSSHRLRIPPEFVKNLNGVLPYKSTITSPAERSWQVEVYKNDDNSYFCQGWHQFVLDNSLEFGDFLVFYYGGNAQFYVQIYGKNGCQKETTYPTSEIHRADPIPKENQTVKRRRSNQLGHEASTDEITEINLYSRVPIAIQEDDTALMDACKFMSNFPFFKVVMNHTYLKQGFMNIPASFFKSYMESKRGRVTLLLREKTWPVKLVRCGKNICRFSEGWRVFINENTLNAGNVCIFELIEREDFVLKVSIFR